ncbi:MAG: acetate kinase [Flavobacteriales bacterium]|jgi:acetate kinase
MDDSRQHLLVHVDISQGRTLQTSPLTLVINSGSSSLKFIVFDALKHSRLLEGTAERLGADGAELSWSNNKQSQRIDLEGKAHSRALGDIFKALKALNLIDRISAVGHRVVHGAEFFKASVVIDADVIKKIEQCSKLAPLHNPANILGIELVMKALPSVPQVAVFDTAFHQTIPKHAYIYPLPYKLYREHSVRRYGFHGTSHRYVSEQAIKVLELTQDNNAIITLHLGNGCSATAVRNGQSVDTSMGLTPLEGLCMGTRSGDIDPGIPHFLCDQLGYSAADVNAMLNKHSGLLGISELSNDMRSLMEAAEAGNEQAELAIHIFCYRLAKTVGALAVSLGRVDAVVFTGGIGENSAAIRARVTEQLSLLGFNIDHEHNKNHGRKNNAKVSTIDSKPVLVIQTQEELMIAQETQALTNTTAEA